MDEMSKDRHDAIKLLCARGWAYRRDGKRHRFTRPDHGGLWDVAQVSHNNLSLAWALDVCARNEDDLGSAIAAVKMAWAKNVIPSAFQ